jgi:aryl-alcohol dehydrogenase-like predicted oxidoreductase
MPELILGTVQFGLDYGITNSQGQLADDDVVSMLQAAHTGGVSTFDTAADYGDSQHRLGKLWPGEDTANFITKFSLPLDGADASAENLYLNSMHTLRVSRLAGLLFHKQSDLLDRRLEQTLDIMRNARADGAVRHIGVSVYNLSDLREALEVFPDLDLVQLPANVLDLDLLHSDEVTTLKQHGCQVHVRSIFLQGILLAEPSTLPTFFKALVGPLTMLKEVAESLGVTVLDVLVSMMKRDPLVDALVIGATGVGELNSILGAWNSEIALPRFELPAVPSRVLDPREWPRVRLNT